MNLFNVANIMQMLSLSLSEKGMKSAEVVLTGFVVVFSVLLLLILIIKIYSTIVVKVTQSGQKTKKIKNNDTSNKVSVEKPLQISEKNNQEQDGISEEVIAVISAAVATMYGPQTKTRIKSIKKSNSGRNAWANAGVLENTRPF